MFKKMQNRKGFTLIEMLVVIAIIAILVGVMIPIVSGSTDKASAATNASNLRGVEGEIITMMLLEPEIFGDQKGAQETINQNRENLTNEQNKLENDKQTIDQLNRNLEDARKVEAEAEDAVTAAEAYVDQLNETASSFNWLHQGCTKASDWKIWNPKYTSHASTCGYEYSESNAAELITANAAVVTAKGVLSVAKTATSAAQTAVDNWNAQNAADRETNRQNQAANNQAEYDLYRFVAVDGVLNINDEVSLEAPASKAVSTDTLTIAKDQQMVVYVDNYNYQAYAYYLSGDEELSAKDFAIAAGNEDLAS